MTPPKPVGSGQVPITGSVASDKAAISVEPTQARAVPQPNRAGAAEDQPPGPDHRRQEERDRRKAEELHDEVGDDGAGEAEGIPRIMVGGVAEAGIVDGPGGETRGDRRSERRAARGRRSP